MNARTRAARRAWMSRIDCITPPATADPAAIHCGTTRAPSREIMSAPRDCSTMHAAAPTAINSVAASITASRSPLRPRHATRPRPSSMYGTRAATSMVMSMMVEAAAKRPGTPHKDAARAPMTKPPTCENGSVSPALSRIRRPQMKQRKRPSVLSCVCSHQATPTSAITPRWNATMAAKPVQPSVSMAAPIAPTPTRSTSTVRPMAPTMVARIARRFIYAATRVGGSRAGASVPMRKWAM